MNTLVKKILQGHSFFSTGDILSDFQPLVGIAYFNFQSKKKTKFLRLVSESHFHKRVLVCLS